MADGKGSEYIQRGPLSDTELGEKNDIQQTATTKLYNRWQKPRHKSEPTVKFETLRYPVSRARMGTVEDSREKEREMVSHERTIIRKIAPLDQCVGSLPLSQLCILTTYTI